MATHTTNTSRTMTDPVAPTSVIRPYGYAETECGYCKGSRSSLVNKDTSNCSKSYSILANVMTPSTYEGFINRGWRRSGIHIYKPSNFESCCPTLAIRLRNANFRPSKSQQRIMKRMRNLMRVETQPQPSSSLSTTTAARDAVVASGILNDLEEASKKAVRKCLPTANETHHLSLKQQNEWKTEFRLLQQSARDQKQGQLQAVSVVCAQISGSSSSNISRENLAEKVVRTMNTDGALTFVSKDGRVSVLSIEAHQSTGQIRCRLAIQQATTTHNLSSSGDKGVSTDVEMKDVDVSKNGEKKQEGIFEDKLARWYRQTTGKTLTLTQRQITVSTMAAHESALISEAHRLYTHYQNVVHGDPDPFAINNENALEETTTAGVGAAASTTTTTTKDKTAMPPVNHTDRQEGENDADDAVHQNEDREFPSDPSELDWGNAPSYFEERIQHMLTRYLQTVPEDAHKKVLESYYSYYQFLVEAPFPFASHQHSQPIDISSKDCGLYHQHYRLNDVLIAVGVIDVLPTGLSSVYLYYHPSFSHDLVALGKYAILKEIEYARDTLKLPYYYLGYYIESCQKMRYKAEYHPSELLCPKYYQWVEAPMAIGKLQRTPCQVCALVGENGIEEIGKGNGDRMGATLIQNGTNSKAESATKDLQILNRLQMDIGAGINVTLDMLQTSGVEVVQPILEDFLSEAGPEWSSQCLIMLS